MLRTLRVRLVEERRRDPEPFRRAADFVQGDETVVAIEGGVLDALGHHRPRELLQPHREAQRRGPADLSCRRLLGLPGQHALEEIERRRMDVGIEPARSRERPGDVAPVGFDKRAGEVDIGPVDGKAGDDRLDRALKDRAGEIRRHRALAGEARGGAAERAEFARHLVVHDPDLEARAISSKTSPTPAKAR